MSCAIFGDSISVGLATIIKGCAVVAKVGMSSAWIAAHAYAGSFDTVYISSGSNDPTNPALVSNLRRTRAKNAARTIWIAPVNAKARAAVYAAAGGDPVVTFVPGKDRVHPKSYAILAHDTGFPTIGAAKPKMRFITGISHYRQRHHYTATTNVVEANKHRNGR